MEFFRVGEKLISLQKIIKQVVKIFKLRARGFSQQEVAQRLSIDRSFISRLETLGEVRKGKKVAAIGFPLKNKDEIEEISKKAGVELTILMNDVERWDFVRQKSAMDFFNAIMQIIAKLRDYDLVILIGSDKWLNLADALLNNEVIFLDLGKSPIEQDCYLDPERYKVLLDKLLENRHS